MIALRGMTWNHPRGLDPLVAHARAYEKSHDVRIHWDARSLEEFEAFPLDTLAAEYDLMVIDHPHVGMAAASDCLSPLDVPEAGNTAGNSNESYYFAGHQWALAIDAAAQVSARCPGALSDWPATWDHVFDLARAGRVVLSLAPVHAIICFLTLCANFGTPCATQGDELIAKLHGIAALDDLIQLAQLVPPACFDLNPIGVFEHMITDDRASYAPLVYGYVSYATDGFRAARLEFGNIPSIRGSTLGGTGIAVSAKSSQRNTAIDVAFDLASAKVQCAVYANAGGQPAHRAAWNDNALNASTHNFFRSTLATLDAAYLRPRFDGYITFQESAGRIVVECLKGAISPAATIDRLNEQFASAQKAT